MAVELEARRWRAAWVLALALWASAGKEAPEPQPPTSCPDGFAEVEAEDGASVRVHCALAAGSARPVRGPARLLLGLPIDLNHAPASTLEALPGIGPQRAAAMVAARCERPFANVHEVERVHGIGPTMAARLRPYVSAEGRSAACERSSSTLPP